MKAQTVQKVLNWTVKLAGMVVCAPVTWIVAGELFIDISPVAIRYLVQFSGVLLVEGVLLSNWFMLDYDYSAAPEIKARYAATALIMYLCLWILAIYHKEGAAGIVFRTALGLALLGSGWDTYIITWQKLTSKADKDVLSDGSVKKHRRKAAIADAKAAIDIEFRLLAEQRTVDTDVQFEALKRVKEQRMANVKKEHREAMVPVSDSEAPTSKFPFPVNKARDKAVNNKRDDRKSAIDKMLSIYQADPYISPTIVADKIGRSRQTVYEYLDKLEADGKIHRNGNGIEVLSGD